MKLILSLSMLAALPLLAVAAPLEQAAEALPQSIGKRQAPCGGSVSLIYFYNTA